MENEKAKAKRAKKPRPTIGAEEMAKSATWLDRALPRRRGTWECVTVRPGGTETAIAAAPMQVLERHWVMGKSELHLNPPHRCYPCEAGLPLVLKGFLLCLQGGLFPKLFLLEITEGAILGCPDLMDPTKLVGHWVTARRPGSRPNSRLIASIGEPMRNFTPPAIPIETIRQAICELFVRRTKPVVTTDDASPFTVQ